MNAFEFTPIGVVESCYKEKFAIPRQPGLVPSGRAIIRILPPYNSAEAFDGLQQSSHLWIQFVFHKALMDKWRPQVRPPRLGGNKKLGVFATRSTHRPNPIGLSVVKLDSIDFAEGVALQLSGIDVLDGTPVLDIKPYIPYADRVASATHGFANDRPSLIPISFTERANRQIVDPDLRVFITEVLQQDPRPAYQAIDTERVYGVNLLDFNLTWRYIKDKQQISIQVLELAVLAHP